MRALLLVPSCFVTLLVPVAVLAHGGDGGFEALVQTLETKYHVQATRIPMMGLVSLIARRTEGGVSSLHVAEFENLSQPIEPEELAQTVQQRLGADWQPVIREFHRRPREGDEASTRVDAETLVFMRPEGERMGMIVLDRDAHEMDVVQLSVDPQHLSEQVAHYARHGEQKESAGSH